MSTATIISITISAFSCLVGSGAIWKLIEMGKHNGKIEQRIFTLETRADEDREKDRTKFGMLFQNWNEVNERLGRIETKLDMILKTEDRK